MKKLRKGKYKVKNWSTYNNSLKHRGDVTFWLSESALENWEIKDQVVKTRGGQLKYSKVALQTILYSETDIQFTFKTSRGVYKIFTEDNGF